MKRVQDIAEWGLVVFGKPTRFDRYFGDRLFRVVNNDRDDSGFGEAGHNRQFEFGGYLEVMEGFETEGPYVVVNDTLFGHHHTGAWLYLIDTIAEGMLEEPKGLCVIGDIRRDGSGIPERPDPFMASWLFVIPNRASLEAFKACLRAVLEREVPAVFSPSYEAFLNAWLKTKSIWSGWQGRATEANVMRKRRCIYWEHALSKELALAGVDLVSVGRYHRGLYAGIRVYDRLWNRWKALKSFQLK